ncbi:MAG: DUF839 domain-containing protein [Leptolyngbyaceae cyanobacterium MO_188.B28]|nr:DUF839 domain-containing protein [Leptolyngbyaceae cyanobacterium MO_188.B28]
MSRLSRRQFAVLMAAAAAGTAVGPMGLLNARRMLADGDERGENCFPSSFNVPGFGPISPKVPLNTSALGNVAGAGDLRGKALLRLPDGFQYKAISIRGDVMSDGVLVPGDHDGMAVFSGPKGSGVNILVRNHELSPTENEAGSQAGCLAPNGRQYDPFRGDAAGLGGGGTTTVVVDYNGNKVRDFVSLGGTIRNCAGGPAPWGGWITCEENTSTPANNSQVTKKHGYNFEVNAFSPVAVDPVPLIAMGRMNHEAVSVSRNGIVYETEDRGDSCYYKFVPKVVKQGGKVTRTGQLLEGDLFAMVIDKNQRSSCNGDPLPTSFLQGAEVVDTRGTARGAKSSMLPFLGQSLKVRWVKLDDVDPEEDTLRLEAQSKGASVFWRGEGAWEFNGLHYWVNSGAGDSGEGQVMCYDPKNETVTLIVESTNENLLDGPDNITVAPDGVIYLCEDGSDGNPGDPNFSQYIVGINGAGGLFQMAQNILDTSEFAGACFSKDGKFLYVNSQGVGITYVIWREDGRPITLGDDNED